MMIAILLSFAPSAAAQGYGRQGGFGQRGVVQPGGQPMVQPQVGYGQPVVMQSGGGGWPALGTARPEGELNPHLEEASLNYDFLGPGIALFAFGYLTSLVTGSVLLGVQWSGGETCQDVTGGLSLIPILGPILGMIVASTCSNSSGYVPLGTGHLGHFVPVAALQIVGLGLAIPGLLQNHQSVTYGQNRRSADPEVSFALSAPNADVGVSLRLTH